MKENYITTNEALGIIKASWLGNRYKPNLPALILWIKKYDLGFKFAGRWQVDKNKLEKFIGDPNGKKKAKK